MINYSINDLENLTGIKAHTIRIWEKRYGILSPERSTTNIRHYSNEELRKLINITILYKSGVKISHIAQMKNDEIYEKLELLHNQNQTDHLSFYEIYIGNLITAGLNFDEAGFEKNFSNAILRYGLINAYSQILMPMLQRIGLLWNTGNINPGQEHFISNLVIQKIYSAIDGLQPMIKSDETWLLFLPQHEDHEISLLMASYLLRNAGKRVIYLGAKVPYDVLKQTVQICNPTHLLLIILRNQPIDELQQYLDKLAVDFNSLKINIGGNSNLLTHATIKIPLTLVRDFNNFVNKI